ncbi:hypothetical protein E4634_19950 [Mangrovimicrobium sediminis]|uniref:LssY-like C-terminal domain-containing protein n=1 Tax=Mangrovimicrobium sediminis TaxID=2562682 RepID=A0A4Z0LVG6_9GAMM|nr:hypothetical protein [Haliea sp. SAOS-164]TGD71118.1 hypothetical protein E4634_19950 [Haliea sp. SAOS-164]
MRLIPFALPRGLLLALLAILTGCGVHSFKASDPAAAPFLARALTQEQPGVAITAAVPDAAETEALTGIDLYDQDIQPVWLVVENRGDKPLRIALRSIDAEYYSPIEVAYMNRGPYSSQGYADMQRWFHQHGLPRGVPPGEQRAGFVFTRRQRGTKGFNVDVFSASGGHSFTFFVPMPGFTADYTTVDFASLYPPERMRDLDLAGLRRFLETELSCCASGPQAGDNGGPLNVAMIGSSLALRRALLRGGWQETRAGGTLLASARRHLFEERGPDAIFYLERADGNEMLNLHLWLAPWTVDGEPAWIGQVYYREFEESLLRGIASNETLRNSAFLSRYIRESVAADIDAAQRFLLQNFWYNQSLSGFGVVGGVGYSSEAEPALTFDGIGYFSDGFRHVLKLSETPVPLDGVHLLYGDLALPGTGEAR